MRKATRRNIIIAAEFLLLAVFSVGGLILAVWFLRTFYAALCAALECVE